MFLALLWVLGAGSCFGTCGDDDGKPLRLATTTSVKDSGLLSTLLPAFEAQGGYRVTIAAVGSGKSLEMLAAGEVDVAITHAPQAEEQGVTAGKFSRRTPIMHNDFVVVGPSALAPVVAGSGDIRDVLTKIAGSGEPFVSRGDDSGTHRREQALWRAAGVSAADDFIVSAHAGMGQTLLRASEEKAFSLTDRATFISLRDELDLAILFQGDPELRNVYAVVEPAEGTSGADAEAARAFATFLRSEKGRSLIGQFGVDESGESLFTPEP